MATSSSSSPKQTKHDQDYKTLEGLVSSAFDSVDREDKEVIVTTDAAPGVLWDAYITNIPGHIRQTYTCSCCRRFIQNYGGLAVVHSSFVRSPLFWSENPTKRTFYNAIRAMKDLVDKAKITGVFYSKEQFLGTPLTGAWTHLHTQNPQPFSHTLLSADQMAAQKLEEYGMLGRAVAEFKIQHVQQAVELLTADALYRSEKAEAIATWFLKICKDFKNCADHVHRCNMLWREVALAPTGFCHIRSSILGTLLEDLTSGYSLDAVKRRWAEKLHPLQYQRPQAAPTKGAIDAAEKIFEKLQLAPALKRRYARLTDVLKFEWKPRTSPPTDQTANGLFGHLRPQEPKPNQTPSSGGTMTWVRFREKVLGSAVRIQVKAPSHGPYYGIVTAVDPDAPPLLQWDGLEECARNPVSHYVYTTGSNAVTWGLKGGQLYDVAGIFREACHWQKEELFQNHAKSVYFAIPEARERSTTNMFGRSRTCPALFPETLRSELREVRSVIEAYNKSAVVTGVEEGNANGLRLQSDGGSGSIWLRVTSESGLITEYTLDRFE